jgi:hypothetical protein
MRKIIQNIDERNWRTLDFLMFDKKNKLQAQNETLHHNISVKKSFIYNNFHFIY